jgi:hypothetical protein
MMHDDGTAEAYSRIRLNLTLGVEGGVTEQPRSEGGG